ncbi:elongation factor 1-beta [Candidatus Pacearchaeota archaeon]|nr:elongation factor 1-beta [Candidatus Pacearchaeota archaeon]
MATVTLIIKIMPDSPEADLQAIKTHAQHAMDKEGAKHIHFEEKPIAFGLKAVMMKFDLPEEKGTETVEQHLSAIHHVSSVTIEDYRRAFG